MSTDPTTPVTADDLRDQMRGREAACRAFAGQPPDEAGVYELPPDRDPWTALDDALNAMWAEVTPKLEWLRAELARLRAGEADEPGERDAQPTAAQLLRRLNDANVDERLRIVERMLDANDRAARCLVMDHEAAIEDQRRRADRAEAERAATLAAIHATRMAHIREVHPTRIVIDDCPRCKAFLEISRRLPFRPDSREEIEALIERSSLGTPEAKALRESTPPEAVERILARAKELDIPDTAPEAGG